MGVFVQLELISKSDQLYNGRKYTKRNYNNIRKQNKTKLYLYKNVFNTVSIEFCIRDKIGTVLFWDEDSITVEIDESLYKSYKNEFDNGEYRAGMNMICKHNDPVCFTIQRVIGFTLFNKNGILVNLK